MLINQDDKRPLGELLFIYQQMVSVKHPDKVAAWPLIRGWNTLAGAFKGWQIWVAQDAPFSVWSRSNGIGELPSEVIGYEILEKSNREAVRKRLEQHFSIGPRDAVLIFSPNINAQQQEEMAVELEYMIRRHESATGTASMKIFLSHKGADKPQVRDFKNTLQLLGFDPWLDEDSMHAGVELERGILAGFNESCAAVFFITKNFKDEDFIASEINYAIAEKRKKGSKFSIITIVFRESGTKGSVPSLLHPYVWKEPDTDLEALREIVKALPIKMGDAYWR